MKNFKNTLRILLIVSVLSVSTVAIAQDFTYGLKAGANIPSFNFEESSASKSSILGIYAGVFGNIALGENFSIQPELIYSTGGAKYVYNIDFNPMSSTSSSASGSVAATKIDDRIKTGYLSLPVMLQYKIIEGLYIEAGPQYNLLLSIEESHYGSDYRDIKEYYKTGTFAIAAGIGYDLSILAPGLSVGLRYAKDLSNMNNQTLEGGAKLKASKFQVGLAYAFGR